jgi:hypothetical protein
VPLEGWIPHSRVDQFLYDWQTVIAGLAALLAALIAVGGSEWRARKALRSALASEARLYVDLLIKTRESLKRQEPRMIDGSMKQRDLRDLALLYPPTVYPAAAAGALGLLRRPRSAAVVDFYATVERLNFAVKAMSNSPNGWVTTIKYLRLIELVEEASRTSLPLLSKFPLDKRDAEFREEIAKWEAEQRRSVDP